MSTLTRSLRPVASFTFSTPSSQTSVSRLCLIPGHYNTAEVVFKNSKAYLSYADPTAIANAGYSCDQVADDFSTALGNSKADGTSTYPVTVKSKNPGIRYRDFLNYIRTSNLRVVKMRITDLTPGQTPSREIFQQVMEVTKSSIGSKNGSDFIQLSQHINPANYLQNFIEIDLEKQNMLLDETTLAFLEIPGDSNFQIDFTLAE